MDEKGGQQEITHILYPASVKTKPVAFKEDWETEALSGRPQCTSDRPGEQLKNAAVPHTDGGNRLVRGE